MNNSRINDNKIQFLTALLIFVSISPLFDIFHKLIASASVVAVLYYYASNDFTIKFRDLIILIISLFFLVFYGFTLDLIFVGEISFQGVGFFIFVLIGFLISQKVTRENFLLANEKLVGFTLVIGLPIYAICYIYPELSRYGFSYSYGGFTHETFIILNILIIDESPLQRFCGFGSEPGLTQIFYLLALFSRISRSNRRIDFFSLTIIIAIFFSRSTFGIFLAIYVLARLIPLKILFGYIIILSPILFFTLIDELNYHISEKLVGSDSFALRYDRYLNFFNSDVLSIILGNGNSYYLNFTAPFNFGGWDSFLQVSQRYGLIFVFLLFAFLIINTKKDHIPVLFIILLAFFSQSISFLPVIAYFYFSGKYTYVYNLSRDT
jgi:hypothetical protein